jgi:hypothetical protein
MATRLPPAQLETLDYEPPRRAAKRLSLTERFKRFFPGANKYRTRESHSTGGVPGPRHEAVDWPGVEGDVLAPASFTPRSVQSNKSGGAKNDNVRTLGDIFDLERSVRDVTPRDQLPLAEPVSPFGREKYVTDVKETPSPIRHSLSLDRAPTEVVRAPARLQWAPEPKEDIRPEMDDDSDTVASREDDGYSSDERAVCHLEECVRQRKRFRTTIRDLRGKVRRCSGRFGWLVG